MAVITGLDNLTPASVAWLYDVPQPPLRPSNIVACDCPRCGDDHVRTRKIPAVEWRRYVRDVAAWEQSLLPETLEFLRSRCRPSDNVTGPGATR